LRVWLRIITSFALICLLGIAPLWAQSSGILLLGNQSPIVSFDALGPNSSGAAAVYSQPWTSPETLTWSHAVGTGANLLTVGVATGIVTDTGETTACTYNSVSMSQVGSTVHGGASPNGYVQLFQLVSPAVGAHNVVCTVTGSDTSQELTIVGGSVSFNNAGPISVSNTATGNGSTAPSVTVSSGSANGMFVSAMTWGGDVTLVSDSQTSRWVNDFTSDSGAGAATQSTAPGAPSATFSYVLNTGGDDWAVIGAYIP
jgi:hypothetical protein